MSYLQGRWGALSAAPQGNTRHTSRPSIHSVSYITLLIVLSWWFGLFRYWCPSSARLYVLCARFVGRLARGSFNRTAPWPWAWNKCPALESDSCLGCDYVTLLRISITPVRAAGHRDEPLTTDTTWLAWWHIDHRCRSAPETIRRQFQHGLLVNQTTWLVTACFTGRARATSQAKKYFIVKHFIAWKKKKKLHQCIRRVVKYSCLH